jgi:hypothetical protein
MCGLRKTIFLAKEMGKLLAECALLFCTLSKTKEVRIVIQVGGSRMRLF